MYTSHWRRQWQPTPVLLPGKSHGQRSLVGFNPWGREESDTTEQFPFHFSLLCTGEGNGNPLQCSCLENPRDGGAWWAAVYGVAQSRTRLKWLSIPHIHIYGLLHFEITGQCGLRTTGTRVSSGNCVTTKTPKILMSTESEFLWFALWNLI